MCASSDAQAYRSSNVDIAAAVRPTCGDYGHYPLSSIAFFKHIEIFQCIFQT
jgi:hypothetical protein